MNAPIPTMPQLAQEAEFQLLAAKDQLEWITALAGAIHLDYEHDGGRHARSLAALAKFLEDTGFAGIDSAIDEMGKLGKSAPQNDEPLNRGAHGVGETLGQRVIWAREKAGLSQQDLAAVIKVKQGTISYLESGKTKRSGCIPDIARACKVDIGWLAFGSEVAQ